MPRLNQICQASLKSMVQDNCQILANVPEGEEGESHKEPKGATKIWHQGDNAIADHLKKVDN